MPGCWLYLLRCADGSFYTGTTRVDPDYRASQHNQGIDPAAYTYARRPVELVYGVHFERIVDAIAAERQVKGWSRAKKEALIRGEFERLPWLAKRPGARSLSGSS